MIGIHRIPFHYFKGISILMLPIVILLLIYTVSQGTTIGGANASRWIRIPFVGIGFSNFHFSLFSLDDVCGALFR